MVTALVTGGTSGIGAAFARTFAERGDNLVLVARDQTRLDETAAALRHAFGVDVETVSADLSNRDDVLRVAEVLGRTDDPIDILVNNAGFGIHTSLLSEDTTPHERALDVMGRAVLLLGGAAGRAMRARGAGTIINISSVAGYITMGSYSAIKAWVTSYTEGLAVELKGTVCRSRVCCRGGCTPSSMNVQAYASRPSRVSLDRRRRAGCRLPGRCGERQSALHPFRTIQILDVLHQAPASQHDPLDLGAHFVEQVALSPTSTSA